MVAHKELWVKAGASLVTEWETEEDSGAGKWREIQRQNNKRCPLFSKDQDPHKSMRLLSKHTNMLLMC